MQAVLVDTECAEGHVLNFNGPIKSHQVLHKNRAHEQLTPMDDYFSHDALFVDNFHQRFRMWKNVSNRLYNGARAYDDYFI